MQALGSRGSRFGRIDILRMLQRCESHWNGLVEDDWRQTIPRFTPFISHSRRPQLHAVGRLAVRKTLLQIAAIRYLHVPCDAQRWWQDRDTRGTLNHRAGLRPIL